jgi:hypothetical protein
MIRQQHNSLNNKWVNRPARVNGLMKLPPY